jgi:hypothetical protein
MWACPKCNRKFKSSNQAHSCAVMSIDSHFEKKQPAVRLTYDKVISEVRKLCDVRVTAVKSGILVSSKSNFLSFKPRTDHLEVEFLLEHELDEFPVYKVFRLSRKKVAHYVKVGSAEEVDRNLIELILLSYKAACS